MKKLNVMVIGAHPDDCDIKAGGTALKYLAAGHRVMFLSMTDGSMGHHLTPGVEMAARRFGEIRAVTELTGIEYKMLNIPDGSLTADLMYREMLMREIRVFKPDLIITHRPNDYHPDHRNTGQLVMDCSYLIIVPGVVPDVPPPRQAPCIFYMSDNFTFPGPFAPHTAIGIDEVLEAKMAILDCHVSQVYEWLPWADNYPGKVPLGEDKKSRLEWLAGIYGADDARAAELYRNALVEWYGEKGRDVRHCEAFALCEYGRQTDREGLHELFPF
ncbi:MAG: PIG-L family deacetylase [Treponema sp.]|jgi:LmbE family N-acetylglucosaminyl deacetylase|nr:PIG-L family deacetylase [Treponema sp.]